jgi:hypothetical protein
LATISNNIRLSAHIVSTINDTQFRFESTEIECSPDSRDENEDHTGLITSYIPEALRCIIHQINAKKIETAFGENIDDFRARAVHWRVLEQASTGETLSGSIATD